MKNYSTYEFGFKSHWNEFAPNVKLRFTSHQDDDLEEVIEMMANFLIACGYSQSQIKDQMSAYAEE